MAKYLVNTEQYRCVCDTDPETVDTIFPAPGLETDHVRLFAQ